ncbi:MAG: lysophospholipid acyltransferase family protein, partial [Chromatiaceae bacterium]
GLARFGDRLLARLAGLLALRSIQDIEGWERIHPLNDPFLLVANHSSRREALLLPAILLLARGGSPVRFLADWNFRLIPGMGHLYDRTGTITLTRKDARPRLLNRLKPLFEPPIPAHVEALGHLRGGGSIGLFPEGTVNRDSTRLLRGRRGAARLSLEAGVPVVPVGIRFTRVDPRTGRVDSASPLRIRFGEALRPPHPVALPASLEAVSDRHEELMRAIAALCGKGWPGTPPRSGIRTRTWQPVPPFIEPRRGDTPC